MVEYAIIHNLTDYGVNLMASDPSVANNLVIQADAHAKLVTNNNYGIGSTYLDLEGQVAYYDIAPLTVSAQMEMQQASLGVPSLSFLDTMKKLIAYAIPVGVGIIAGAIAGGIAGSAVPVIGTGVGVFIGAIAGASIGASINLFSYLDQRVEVKQTYADIQKQLTDMLERGDITPEEYNDANDAVTKGMETGIPWKTIIIGGMIGVGALAALYIFMKKGKL